MAIGACGGKEKEVQEEVGYRCQAYQVPCKWASNQGRCISLEESMLCFNAGNQDIKSDYGKPQISLVPPQIIRDIAEVREYGVKKYGSKESWRDVSVERYINALLRHTLLFMEDPDGVDEESGIKHYKHIACNLAFLCELMKGEE